MSLPNHDASIPSSENKYDIGFESPGSPGPQTQFDTPLTLEGNKFPKDKGSDSLSTEEDLLT